MGKTVGLQNLLEPDGRQQGRQPDPVPVHAGASRTSTGSGRPVYVVDPVSKTLTHYRIARFLGVTRQLPFEFTIQAIRYSRQSGFVWAIMHQAKKCEFLVDFLDYGSNSKQVVDAYAVTVNQALHGQPSFETIAPAPSPPAHATAAAHHSPFTPSHYPR